MNDKGKKLPDQSRASAVAAFLRQVAKSPAVKPAKQRGRLIFAMDATASREPTWDKACHIQNQMFEATMGIGGLDVQLCYYRGYGEFAASPWLSSAQQLHRKMGSVRCVGGMTQMEKILAHGLRETEERKINALVFVGDCMEEPAERLFDLAGQLGLRGVPVFLFQEGMDPVAERAFRQIARLTKGAYCRFDAGSAQQLADLLSAVAVYAVGGRSALDAFEKTRGGVVPKLLQALSKE